MAVKSIIPSLALRKLNELYWGIKVGFNVNDQIYNNYIEYLDCPDVINFGCGDVPCDNPTISFTCTLTFRKLTEVITGNNVIFSALAEDVINAIEPVTYKWTYDEDYFDLTGGSINSSSIFLALKPPRLFSLIVSKITLEIMDGSKCKVRKDCYITPSGLQCNNFIPCPPVTNLTVMRVISPITIYYGFKDDDTVYDIDDIVVNGTPGEFEIGDAIVADYTDNPDPKRLWIAIPQEVSISMWFVTDNNKGHFGDNELFGLPTPVGDLNFYITNYNTAQTQLPIKFLL